MSGLTQEELDAMKTRSNKVLDKAPDHDSLTVQLAADVRMLLLDKKLKET